jgi:NADH-quinone oxidoreductase subunit G
VDLVISTRELAKMIKEAGISFTSLTDGEFDHPMGLSSGAGVIFGASGGVLEAALRTAYEWITGQKLHQVEFTALRGLEGVKEAAIKIGDMEIKVAASSGLGNARDLLERVRAGKSNYHVIEIMACPGGCIDGGGQPYHHGNVEVLRRRANTLYEADKNKPLRKSHENPYIKQLYQEFLGEPYGRLARELLHTVYIKRELM